MTPFQIRTTAAAGLASAAFLVLAGNAVAPSTADDAGAAAFTPRTAKTCQAEDCPMPPERIKLGYGNGGSMSPAPFAERDPAARWAR